MFCFQSWYLLEGAKVDNSSFAPFAGPYVPVFNKQQCNSCGGCLEQCRVKALNLLDGFPHLAKDRCLGCGLCATHCPENAVDMAFMQDRIRKQSEPGWIKMILIYLFMYTYMFPMFILFRTFAGSHGLKREKAVPNTKDTAVFIENRPLPK